MATPKETIAKEKERATRLAEQAKRSIPPEYHAFILPLDQNVRIGVFDNRPADLLEIPGVWSKQKDGKWVTYYSTTLPYVQVDGRVAMAHDDHAKDGKKLTLSVVPESVRLAVLILRWAEAGRASDTAIVEALKQIPPETKNILTCTADSEKYGIRVGSAKIGWGGDSVDATNPYENAGTSAIGRALGFMGYGLIGGGIASYEEVMTAKKEQQELRETPQPTPAVSPAPEQAGTDKLTESSDGGVESKGGAGDSGAGSVDPKVVTIRGKTYPVVPCEVCQKPIDVSAHVIWIEQAIKAAEKAIAAGKSPHRDSRTNQPVSWDHPVHPPGNCR